MKRNLLFSLVILIISSADSGSFAQDILSRTVSLDVNRQRLDNVLEILSNKGDFYFSYNSSIVKKDSLVSISVSNKSVKNVLSLLLNNTYEFRESGNYIIIRKAPIRTNMVIKKAAEEQKIYSVSGFVYDERSGTPINEASIYEKKLLASVLTNSEGYFKMRLKSSKAVTAELTLSKESYEDTTFTIEPAHNQELVITMMPVVNAAEITVVGPKDYLFPDSITYIPDTTTTGIGVHRIDSVKVEMTGMARFLLSSKQRVQSLNLEHFFTTRYFQFSIIPGLSTHGQLASQVVNNFSLNVLGGYAGGTSGLELGGLFNIDKKEVRYLQAAGIFNIVGGEVIGLQLAGVNNTVLDTVRALQVAGVSNVVKGKMNGLQIAGVYNHVMDSLRGMQVSGVGNFARKKMSGVQLAGVVNFSNGETDGAQIAGVINYTRKLRGVQVGLINIADTSEGFSIGFINIVAKGYHKLSFSTDEILDVNAAFKTGNARLYSILQAGVKAGAKDRMYSFGYGLGSEFLLTKRKNFSINPELTSQYLYLGSWEYTNILNKLHLNFNLKLNKYISFFAGPSFALYISNQQTPITGYHSSIPPAGYNTFSFGNNVTGWFGWNAGINFF